MDKCPNCGKILSDDEKTMGECTVCKQKLPKEAIYTLYDNGVAKAVKACGVIIIIVGTILSIIMGRQKDMYGNTSFSFLQFIIPEAISVISGIFFIGFSEVIQLLEDIKSKTR